MLRQNRGSSYFDVLSSYNNFFIYENYFARLFVDSGVLANPGEIPM